jgi:hypothetical protein
VPREPRLAPASPGRNFDPGALQVWVVGAVAALGLINGFANRSVLDGHSSSGSARAFVAMFIFSVGLGCLAYSLLSEVKEHRPAYTRPFTFLVRSVFLVVPGWLVFMGGTLLAYGLGSL